MQDANCEHLAHSHTHTISVQRRRVLPVRFIVLAIKHTNVFVVCIFFTIWFGERATWQHIIVWMLVCAIYIQIIFHCTNRWKTNKWASARAILPMVNVSFVYVLEFFLFHFFSLFSLDCLLYLRLKTAHLMDFPPVFSFRNHLCGKAFCMCKRHILARARKTNSQASSINKLTYVIVD